MHGVRDGERAQSFYAFSSHTTLYNIHVFTNPEVLQAQSSWVLMEVSLYSHDWVSLALTDSTPEPLPSLERRIRTQNSISLTTWLILLTTSPCHWVGSRISASLRIRHTFHIHGSDMFSRTVDEYQKYLNVQINILYKSLNHRRLEWCIMWALILMTFLSLEEAKPNFSNKLYTL